MKLLYQAKLLSLYSKKVRLPNGYQACLEVIKHPGAALIVPFLSDNTIIMLRQLRPVIGRYLYELPAGTRNPKESMSSCCRREIIEETQFAASKFQRLGQIFPVPGYSTEKIVIYKATGLKKCPGHNEKDEIIKPLLMTKVQVKKIFSQGKITDAKTICALAMVGWL